MNDHALDPDAPVTLSGAAIRRAVLASVIGNGLEWFDFLSYAYFASIISRVFFPAGDRTASLLLTLGVFAVGFVVRPLGGLVLGLYADRYGRRKALSLLIVMMAAGTLLVGLTPSYASIGLLAPALVSSAPRRPCSPNTRRRGSACSTAASRWPRRAWRCCWRRASATC